MNSDFHEQKWGLNELIGWNRMVQPCKQWKDRMTRIRLGIEWKKIRVTFHDAPVCSQQVNRAKWIAINPPSDNSSPTQISDDTLPLRWRGARAEAQFTSPPPFGDGAKMTDPVKTRLYHSIQIHSIQWLQWPSLICVYSIRFLPNWDTNGGAGFPCPGHIANHQSDSSIGTALLVEPRLFVVWGLKVQLLRGGISPNGATGQTGH